MLQNQGKKFKLFIGDISPGKDYDLFPYAVEIAVASTYVTTSVPSSDQYEPTLLDIKLSELTETNKKLYIQFDLPKIMKTQEVELVKSNKPPCRSVFEALMRPDNCYPNLKCNTNTNDMRQHNEMVIYYKSNKFGVHPNSLLDFVSFREASL